MKRIDILRNSLGGAAAYITAYPDIRYYSGFTSCDARLLISKERAVLITDSRYLVQAKIESPDFEIYDIRNGLDGAFTLFNEKSIWYQQDNITASSLERAKAAAENREFLPMGQKISEPREVKDKAEIDKIRAAEKLGDDAFSYILERITVGRSERDIALELEFYMRKNGASALSFETIVASGVRSAMPHGTASDKLIEKGDLVTLDFGCVLDGYCSDMTRTIGVGYLTDRAKEIYSVVKNAQAAALDACEVGAELSLVDKVARDIIAAAGYGENFGHSLGHGVGLEIHENPSFSPKSTGMVRNGNVLSVEPGIYIEGFGGVRIEDLVAFYDGKCEILSKSSKELTVI